MLVVAELNSSILPRLGMIARILVARNVMFSDKQKTARKMADQLQNCINHSINQIACGAAGPRIAYSPYSVDIDKV